MVSRMKLWLSQQLFPKDASTRAAVDLPCVVGVVFDAQEPAPTKIEAAPVTGGHCGAVLTDPAAIVALPGVGAGFACAFCKSVVVLGQAREEAPRPPPRERKDGLGPVVAGVIDVSGSMANGSLAAVRQSLSTTLADLEANAKETRFVLVTFASSVHLYGLSSGLPVVAELKEEHLLASEDAIRRWAAEAGRSPVPVGESGAAWRSVIAGLVAEGGTALGPALIAASAVVGEGATRIVLLTDGCANAGIGSLHGPSTAGRAFYAGLASTLAQAGTVVDLVAIAGEGSVEIATLKVLPEATGGELYYVDRAEVAGAFGEIGKAKVVARKARIAVHLPEGLRATEISGVGLQAKLERGAPVRLGSVTEAREIFFAIEPEEGRSLGDAPIPVQVQLRYEDERGNERVESASATLLPTDDAGAIRGGYDRGPYCMMEVQRGGEEALERGLEVAEARLVALRAKLGETPPGAAADPYAARVDHELANVKERLKDRARRAYGDVSSASAYAMAKARSTRIR